MPETPAPAPANLWDLLYKLIEKGVAIFVAVFLLLMMAGIIPSPILTIDQNSAQAIADHAVITEESRKLAAEAKAQAEANARATSEKMDRFIQGLKAVCVLLVANKTEQQQYCNF